MEFCHPHKINGTLNISYCDFVKSSSFCTFDSGFINYFEWQYCGFDNRIAPTILMFFWFLVMLLAIAVTADSFFAPCLVVVTRILKMSQNLAGVTLLALGNGAPDVFSSLSAVISSNKPNVNLAMGSILGGGILVNTITAGIIMIIMPFNVMRRPILKDLIFYFISLIWCMTILIKRSIELWSSIVFIVIYVAYVLVTGISRAVYVASKRKEENQHNNDDKLPNSLNSVNETSKIGKSNPTYLYDFDQIGPNHESLPNGSFNSRTLSKKRKTYIYGEQNNNYFTVLRMNSFKSNRVPSVRQKTMGSIAKMIIESEQQKEFEEFETATEKMDFSRKRSISFDISSEIQTIHNRIRFNSTGQDKPKKKISNEIEIKFKEEIRNKTINENLEKIEECDGQNRYESFDSTNQIVAEVELKEENKFPGIFKHFIIKISPINYEEWKKQSLFSKVLSILQSPIMFILTITIPVVSDDEYLDGWCKILNCLHCIISPAIWVIFIQCYMQPIGNSGFILLYLILIIGAVPAIVMAVTSKADTPPPYYPLFAFIGFITSIIWIYEIANEIVNILETFGVVLSIPQTILGLSVLAFANSIGDLVSNIMLAKKNFPRIAYAACIGGPLFNLLIGIGLPFTIATATYGNIQIKIYSETVVLIFTILLITTLNICALPIMKFNLRPCYGKILIVIYIIFFILVLLFASHVIKVVI